MSDNTLEIDNSPTSPSKEGKFASKKPYIIVGVVIGLFLIGMMYATSVRGEQKKKDAENKPAIAKSDTSRIDKLLEGLKGREPKTDPKLTDLTSDTPEVVSPVEPVILEAPKEHKLSAAEKERLRIQKMRQKQLEAAIMAPMDIPNGDLQKQAQNGIGTLASNGIRPQGQTGMDVINKYLSNYGKGNTNNPQSNNTSSSQKGVFSATNSNDEYLSHKKRKLISPYELKTGSLIPAVLIGGINSELPGKIIAQVRENVYDTATGQYLLIPQGTKIIGVYGANPSYGQNRALVAFNRLVFPDGQTLNLGAMNGIDGGGYAGFEDEVDHHYFRIFGSAFLLSILGGEIYFEGGKIKMASSQDNYRQTETTMQKTAGRMIEKNLGIAPTIKIRNGYRFNIFVTKDMILEPLSSYIDDKYNQADISDEFRRNNQENLSEPYDRTFYSDMMGGKEIAPPKSSVVPIPR